MNIIEKYISFNKLVGYSALGIAGVAAFFSVYGISSIFSGAFLSVIIMATALEIGKLISVTFLYRFWQKTKTFIKAYLLFAAFILMIITSMGIFGYLSAAYQKSAIELKQNNNKIEIIESKKTFYTSLIDQSKERINVLSNSRIVQEARLSEAATNAFLSRNPLQLKQIQEQTINLINDANSDIKQENEKIQSNQEKIIEFDNEINLLKFSSDGLNDIKTFEYVAQQFNVPLDTIVKWFILALIFVFDPLAIALVLAYNITLTKNTEKQSNVIYDSPVDYNADEESKKKIL